MSRANLDQTMYRIAAAERKSPLAVFRLGDAFNVVFANTVKSKYQISSGKDLVGVFHNQMNANEVKTILGEGLNG